MASREEIEQARQHYQTTLVSLLKQTQAEIERNYTALVLKELNLPKTDDLEFSIYQSTLTIKKYEMKDTPSLFSFSKRIIFCTKLSICGS